MHQAPVGRACLAIAQTKPASSRAIAAASAFAVAEVAFRLFMPVDLVSPVGVDIPRADRSNRPRPLLVPLFPPDMQTTAPPLTSWTFGRRFPTTPTGSSWPTL
jgi:hypothetical protein